MRIGLFQNIQWPEPTEQKVQYDNAIRQTLLAEELGFESAFFVEHHWTRHGILSSTLAVLAYLAGRTSRIRLGTGVLVLPLHNPARLVEEASTVDLLSNGRLDLGVGRGFQWGEFNGFGLSLDESAARTEECLDFILKAWRTEGPFTFAGKYSTFNDIAVQPRPVQQPHPPVWVAAGSPDSARRVGRLGLNLQMSSAAPLHRVPDFIAAYHEGLAENGYAFDSSHVMLSRIAHIAETRERAWEIGGPYYHWFRKMLAETSTSPARPVPAEVKPIPPKLSGPIGSEPDDPGYLFCTPDEANRVIEDVAAMGVGHVIFQGNWGGIPQDAMERHLRLIGREMLPHFSTGVK
jgi:alkanesulfonate monooxygenase SsuD/methylene tetrahydromethanopterin reductase-like flavin-dependent oxidoreductase (luciferase family)